MNVSNAPVNELRDALTVTAEIQRGQAEIQKVQAEELELSRKWMGPRRAVVDVTAKQQATVNTVQ
jgi:hypothetical protein